MAEPSPPLVVVLAGPNGAGKTTAAPFLLRDLLGLTAYVNDDVVAQGLSGFDPRAAAIIAGRFTLRWLHDLGKQRRSFAFESTLAGRSPLRFLGDLASAGYHVRIDFLWLRSVELALKRVEARVRRGGHWVPPETIDHRYRLGLRNFMRLYRPLADQWTLYDNSGPDLARMVATGNHALTRRVVDVATWHGIESTAGA